MTTTLPSDYLEVSRRDAVLRLTLNNPARKNAINSQMWGEIKAVLEEFEQSDDRVLVIAGMGGDFSSGADLSGPRGKDQHPLDNMRHIHSVALALHRLSKPTIAQVDGVAAGAGLSMALGCDLVVATTRSRFSVVFTRRGLSPDFGATWLLPRIVGLQRAKLLAFMADVIDAAEAERLGLVTLVVAPEDLEAQVDDWAGRLASGPPIALAQTKALLDASFSSSFEDALDHEARAAVVNGSTHDVLEARDAFLAKRKPIFSGR